MKIKTILPLLLAGAAFCACDNIDEGERLQPTIYKAQRSILIEDFTGQKCVNCPMAANTLHSLSQYFGDSIVSVAIHGGPFGVLEPRGLATREADAYYTALDIKSQPIGVINHRGFTSNYSSWTKEVCDLIKTPTNVTMSAVANIQDDELHVSVQSSSSVEQTAILKVWLTEDSIIALQSMPEAWGVGSSKADYVHNHVYRKAVSDVNGVSVSLSAKATTNEFTCSLSNNYNKENLNIVAFVYNEEKGVLQVISRKVSCQNEGN